MPEWVATLEMAKEWAMAPWEIEDEIPAIWWDRWRVMREEQGKIKPKKDGKGKPTGDVLGDAHGESA